MKILVTGRDGQLARALAETGPLGGHSMVCLGRGDLDIRDPRSVSRAVEGVRPDLVVNAAAYTAVDTAETDEAEAFAVNGQGAGHVAAEAARAGIALIHISTDYVFDGRAAAPYPTDATPAPLNAYGRSKLEGERRVAAANPRHVILRTAWVYSPWGRNFLTTMLRRAAQGGEVRVVDDQTGSPTSALDLARAILVIAESNAQHPGIFHFTNGGQTTWHGLAAAIFEELARRGRPAPQLSAIPSAAFPAPARRPTWSVLDLSALTRGYGIRARPWREALTEVMERAT
jgi:dTDP-4-dehydrorhamnose reductase